MKISRTSSQSILTALDIEHPEWRPLLRVIEETLREAERPHWARFVPELTHRGGDGRPLLDGAVITVPSGLIARWVRQIVLTAAAVGADVELLGRAITRGQIDPVVVFATALSQDDDRLDDLTRSVKDHSGVLRGLSPLIAGPMLQACWSAWANRVPAQWAFGYCPLCGRWPSLAEIRGLDGSRHFRCGCCGSEWGSEWLRCAVCGEGDHNQLGSLVVPDRPEQRVEVCDGCQGYIKTVATLTPIPAEHVVLHDLATLVLDVAALEHDYRRPAAKGRNIEVLVVAERSRLWNLSGLR